MLDFRKYDAYGQELTPGDVCVVNGKGGSPRFCVYKTTVKNSRKGEYGRFITETGIVSLKFTSVIFVFDSISDRRSTNKAVLKLIKGYYEGEVS